jgi:hypothetical protein
MPRVKKRFKNPTPRNLNRDKIYAAGVDIRIIKVTEAATTIKLLRKLRPR